MNSAGNKNRIKKRLVSLVTAATLMTNAMPLNGLSELAGLFSFRSPAVISAEAEFIPSKNKAEFSAHDIRFTTMSDLEDYSYWINNDADFAAEHANDTIRITLDTGKSSVLSSNFMGIGTEDNPFTGTFLYGTTTSGSITLERALFGCITDSAIIKGSDDGAFTLILTRSADVADGASAPLLADCIKHGSGPAPAITWHIRAEGSNTYSGLIGEMDKDAVVDMIFENNNTANLVSNAPADDTGADIGYLCGRMGARASLTVDYRSAAMNKTVTSANGNAGGLVGTMASGASLELKGSLTTYAPAVVSNAEGGYAGGLVGELYSDSTLTAGLGSTVSIGGSSRAANGGAGGLFGHYINKKASETIDVSTYYRDSSKKLAATASGKYGGGLFGVFENDADAQASYTVTLTGTSDDSHTSGVSNSTGHFGGLIGSYKAKGLTDTLSISSLNISTKATNSFAHFGGVIGIVDSPAYIKVKDTTVTATGANKNTSSAGFFGGLVGSAGSGSNGVFIDQSGFTLKSTDNFYGGGVVGEFNSGVLRLSGTTDMTGGKPAGTATSALTNGQLIGLNDNVLTYAVSGWDFKRSGGAYADDLGTWGEVVRFENIETGILTFNASAHTVTVAAAVPAMSSQSDLVKTALSMQLESCGCLTVTSAKATMLTTNLSLGGDISFAGTGITGLMRDGGTPETIGTYTGTFNGNDHNITLAVGETYSYDTTAETTPEGVGQIYRHQYNGLFSILAGTVENLTIKDDSYFNIRNCVDGMNIGGIAACNGGDVTLTKVAANQTVNYHEGNNVTGTPAAGKNIGGLIGFVGANGTITVNGVSSVGAKFKLTGYHQSWNAYGGAIGKVTAETFTIKIGTKNDAANKLTMSFDSDITGITNGGANSDCGGLIGHITKAGSYSNRTVNVNNLIFDGCKIGNKASQNGGGLLGYAWLNTTANIAGMTVTNATITNSSAPNVGAMCYSATGKWIVDSLAVNSLTMTTGGNSSLGMLVNKAFDGDDGLYLDVIRSGYTLSKTGVKLNNSLGVYDELTAYSASSGKLISGGKGVGVVSINMNSAREGGDAKVTVTRTYQDQLGSDASTALAAYTKYANKNTRYYYNLDVMDTGDKGQDLVLWSVNKYAAPNIQGEFGTSFKSTLSGAADLTGLSFYPVANMDAATTLEDLTLTFDYAGIYTTESDDTADGLLRDPGDTGNAQNQHYLMQSGLFINTNEGTKLKVKRALNLGGTFLEVGDYKAALISGTMSGSFDSSEGSITLNGLTPKTTGNAATTNGYLLINNIKRKDTTVAIPELKMHNVSTGAGYDNDDTAFTTTTVASSLIGTAEGPGLIMDLSLIKLDARSSYNDCAEAALYDAYNTYNSIFTTSTLFSSINTDRNAQLIYNYTVAHDWTNGRKVTYGAEVSMTSGCEYPGQENKYFSSETYTNPTAQNGGQYDFSSFRPYVATHFTAIDPNDLYFRDLKVNVVAKGLIEGCGTYNDPYIISENDQLVSVAAFLQDRSNASTLGKVTLPKAKPASMTSGARWCTDKEGTTSHLTYNASATFSAPDGAVGAYAWKNEEVQQYLANAYYKITTNVTLKDTFAGLGGKGGDNSEPAFRGVIVGTVDENNVPTVTIINESDNPLVNVSNGCVIKDVNITVSSDVERTQANNGITNAYFGYEYSSDNVCKFYGGIIGEIMGGDNIIDNTYVTFASGKTVTLKGTSGTIVPVGGYVGVVVFGGLVFKNMDAQKTTLAYSGLNVVADDHTYNLADESDEEAWAAIYVNPLVGRVINGYAVNETGGNAKNASGAAVKQYSVTEDGKYHDDDKTARTGTQHTLKNGTKHYSIADLDPDPDLAKLDVTSVPANTTVDGNINVPNAQALFVLSLITQSTAGTAQTANGDYKTSLSYGTNTTVYGMSHIADYSNVGTAASVNDSDYLLAKSDTAANTAVPYVIYYFTTGDKTGAFNARCVTSTSGYYDINLTGKTANSTQKDGEGEPIPLDSYTYQLPDSFRGLGSVGYFDSNGTVGNRYSLKVDLFNGNDCRIDEDIYLNRYQTDNYFSKIHQNHNATQAIQIQSNTADYDVNSDTNNHGIGLFDSIITKNKDSKISSFSLSGSVNTETYKNQYNTTSQEKIIIEDDSAKFLSTGGVVGCGRGGIYLNFEGISIDNLSVCGSCVVGGILGYSGINSTEIYVKVSQCSASGLSLKMDSASKQEDVNKSRNAIGGLIGKIYGGKAIIYGTELEDKNDDTTKYSTVTLKSFGFQNPDSIYRAAAGGLVGFAGDGCRVYDMKLQSAPNTSVTIGGNKIRFAGGFVGAMQSQSAGGKTGVAIFKNCTLEKINVNGNLAGGFYGGKWDSDWTTYSVTLDNCKVLGDSDNHNTIYGNGLYGDNDKCGFAGGLVGRLYVYTNGNPNVLIKDCRVSNYDITVANEQRENQSGAGGFIGYASSKLGSITCYIHDSSVENCKIGDVGNYSGGVIGKIVKRDQNKILGYNIKLDTITTDSSYMGAWIGYVAPNDDTTQIQFTALGIYGNGFTQNVGSRADFSNAAFVFADYTGASANMNAKASTFNAKPNDNVEMPKYPYVNVNPQSSLGGNEVISGDGAVLYGSDVEGFTGTGKNTMAAKILREKLDNPTGTDKQYYTTFSDIAIKNNYKIDEYMNRTTAMDGDRISTFATERGQALQSGVKDFAVVVIANRDDPETTALLNRYIQLVTNTSSDKNYAAVDDYYKIDIKTCKYDSEDGSFEITDDAPGLTIDNDQFKLDNDHADSMEGGNRFTLLDVQFLDPLGKEKIAYHLYVPVYTIREMAVNFYASARPGTNSVAYYTDGEGNDVTANEYSAQWVDSNEDGALDEIKYFDNLDSWYTHYIRYEYDELDLRGLLNSGKLRWTYKKSFKIDTTVQVPDDSGLPGDTYLVLVDPNANGDRAFYAQPTADGFAFETKTLDSVDQNVWTVDLAKFKDSNKVGYTPKTFNDMLAKDIVVDTSNPGASRYSLGTSSDYDVYVINEDGEKEYYKLNTDNEGDYELSLPEDYKLYEDYYISIYVPKPDDYSNQIYRYGVVTPERFDSGASSIVYEGAAPQIKSANVTQKNQCNVFLADLFLQNSAGQEMNVGPDVFQITASNKTITVDLKTTITPASATGMNYIDDVYHSFKLSLDRYLEGGDFDSKITGLTKDGIKATYSIGTPIDNENPGEKCRNVDLQDNYINIETTDATDSKKIISALSDENGEKKVEIYAKVVMTFDEDELEDEFPTKESSGNIGVNVSATSNLAFYPDSLAFSSSSAPFARNGNYYYIESITTAKLKYNSPDYDPDIYDPIGNSSKNQTKTGVNANYAESDAMLINTVASYSVLSLPDAKDADILRLTFSLSKKTDTLGLDGTTVTGAEYSQINQLSDYLDGKIVFTSGTAAAERVATGDSVTVDLPFGQCETDGDYYKINIAFYVKTGDGFTEYANYRADLKAELFKTVAVTAPEQGEKPAPEEGEEPAPEEGEGGEGEDGGAATRDENIENSVARDYLIYTNAKLCAEFIKHSSGS